MHQRDEARVPRPSCGSALESTHVETGAVDLRRVMARFATGVTVVTAGGAVPHGMTANAFTSLSLDPPLILVCVDRSARMHEVMLRARCFAVSVLDACQEQAARHFADRRRPVGQAQFDAVPWSRGPLTGAPVLDGALAWLECSVADVHEGGDHSIVVGRVLQVGRGSGHDALLFFGGAFHHVRPTASAAGPVRRVVTVGSDVAMRKLS